MHMYVAPECHDVCAKVRGHIARVSSLPLTSGTLGIELRWSGLTTGIFSL